MNNKLGGTPERTSTFASSLLVKDLVNLDTATYQPVPVSENQDTTSIKVIFLQTALYSSLFGHYQDGNSRVSPGNVTDLTRYKYMSHVRKFNANEMANVGGNGESTFSATVSPRTGDFGISAPTTMHAHLISLDGLTSSDSMKTCQLDTKPYALISLYSWTFTALPPLRYSVGEALSSLGRSIQPLRNPDASLIQISQKTSNPTAADTWVKGRLLAGYNLIRHRLQTGESMIALQRGILTPIKFDSLDFPPSDYGSDLAIIDEKTGFLDLTFQLAWEIGRISASADRAISAALMRLRKDVHNQNLESAKKLLDGTFVPATTALSAFQSTHDALNTRLDPNNVSGNNIIPQRWATTPLGIATRVLLSFEEPQVQAQYYSQLVAGIGIFAQAAQVSQLSATPNPGSLGVTDTAPGPYNETQSPLSTDYATVFAWIMDRWFLHGIPFANIIPDPNFIPKESIRCFYVDQSWYKVFVDGALSITDHYGTADEVRESMKASFTAYLTTPLAATGFVPQIPKWGFFMRSEFVTKFPDMRISAPWKDQTKVGKQAEVLRMLTLDTDLLCVLFDREPGDFDPSQGITIQPPEHQLTSMFGTANGVSSGIISVPWKEVIGDMAKTPGQGSDIALYRCNVTNDGMYDSSCHALCPLYYASKAQTAVKLAGNDPKNLIGATPALVGTQLTVVVPKLILLNNQPSGIQLTSASESSLSTSKRRPGHPRRTPPSGPLKTPSIPQDSPAMPVPIYPLPRNPIMGAIAKQDLQLTTDPRMIILLFPPSPSLPPVTPIPNRPANNNPENTPGISTSMFNITAPYTYYVNGHPQPGVATRLITTIPQSLGFTTDLRISMTSCVEQVANLSSVVITIPVGPSSDPTNFFAPLPVAPTPGPLVRNADNLYPRQPRTRSTVLPKVRVTAPGRVWRPETSYRPISQISGLFLITLVPSYGDPDADDPNDSYNWPAWDINKYRDLSLVVEGVQINYTTSQSRKQVFTLAVDEYYPLNYWNPVWINNGLVDVTVQCMNSTFPVMAWV